MSRAARATLPGSLGSMALIERARSGAVIRVKAKPNARSEGVFGVVNEQLVVAVRTPPERGKANEAIVKIVARWLGVPKSSLEILSGAAARDKRILLKSIPYAKARGMVEERLNS